MREFAQSAPELLREDNAGFGAAQHDDLVDGGNIDSLIEHIDSEEIVEFAFSELADVFVSLRLGHGPAVIVRAGNGSGAIGAFILLIPLLVKQLGQLMGFLLSAAEHESGDRNVELPIFLQLVNDVADSLFGGKLLDLVLELFRVLRIKTLGDIETMGDSIRIVVGAKVFRNAVVVEWTEHVLVQRLLQANFVRDVMPE